MKIKKYKNRLSPSVKKRWVAALRSGKYDQGLGMLYNPNTGDYCCLGVLACVQKMSLKRIGFVNGGVGEPPFGLSADTKELLANRNDGFPRRWSFKRIADWIEKHL